MFRLNGDIVKQLKTTYAIHFKDHYRKDLKERILLFVNGLYGNKTLNELQKLKEEIVMENFDIVVLKEEFFNNYKEELFNSFNPLWYSSNKKIYSHEDLEHISNTFVYETLSGLDNLYIDLIKPDIVLENVVYNNKIYKYIENNLVHYMNMVLARPPFRRTNDGFKLVYNFGEYLLAAENGNRKTFNEFIHENHFYIADFSSKPAISEELMSLYYINKVLEHIRKNCIKE